MAQEAAAQEAAAQEAAAKEANPADTIAQPETLQVNDAAKKSRNCFFFYPQNICYQHIEYINIACEQIVQTKLVFLIFLKAIRRLKLSIMVSQF